MLAINFRIFIFYLLFWKCNITTQVLNNLCFSPSNTMITLLSSSNSFIEDPGQFFISIMKRGEPYKPKYRNVPSGWQWAYFQRLQLWCRSARIPFVNPYTPLCHSRDLFVPICYSERLRESRKYFLSNRKGKRIDSCFDRKKQKRSKYWIP